MHQRSPLNPTESDHEGKTQVQEGKYRLQTVRELHFIEKRCANIRIYEISFFDQSPVRKLYSIEILCEHFAP